MITGSDDDVPSELPSGSPKPRRQRYHGTHPRRFQEKYKELDPSRFPEMQAHVKAQGRTPAGTHVPVLLAELIECLRLSPGMTVADCTLGYGGHAAAVLSKILPGGRLIGFDVDGAELERTRARLQAKFPAESLTTVRGNFAGILKVRDLHAPAGFDAVYADLGASSMQLDDPRRGFSYKSAGPLDMRMDDRLAHSAAGFVNRASLDEISAALADFGDEPMHREIAQAMVAARARGPLSTTSELTRIVRTAVGGGSVDPASRHDGLDEDAATLARVFQALRIKVNRELESLRELLRVAPACLAPGGRLAVLTFHSGEDRLVKSAIAEGVEVGAYEAAPQPVTCTPQQRRENPRAASARLRVAIRTRTELP